MVKTKKLTTCACMVAAATVLSVLSKIIPAPWMQGGSVTLASAVPIIIVSLIYGYKWGILTSVTYALIQMMTGFYPPPTKELFDFFLVVMLDYIFAFGVFGIAGVFYKKEKLYTIPISGCIVMILRYLCHILSGILIWGVYAEEGQTVLAYSVIYNGSYMLPEIIITTMTLTVMMKLIKRLEV